MVDHFKPNVQTVDLAFVYKGAIASFEGVIHRVRTDDVAAANACAVFNATGRRAQEIPT
jgi:hypothetical protein